MRRAVVNVGTGRYAEASQRLKESVERFDPEALFCTWNELPRDWPTHEEKPYAFKAHALETASQGADLLLWCDSAIIAVRDLKLLWNVIERDGYWMPLNGWTNYEWTADSAYRDLFPGTPIEEAREINKQFPQVVATAFGVNTQHPTGAEFLREYIRLAKTNAFCGPWANTNNPNNPFTYHESMMGPCGPPDVLGHRHDQTAASVIAWRLRMKLEQCPGFFGYKPPAESVVLCAVGA